MAEKIYFRVVCLCSIEKVNSQLKRIFVIEEFLLPSRERGFLQEHTFTMGSFLSGFFTMVVQAIGKIYKAVRLVDKMLQERYKEGVKVAIQLIQPNPEIRFIADIFLCRGCGEKEKSC
ncbi:hypothetical protein SUGI_0525100 [Cryptomeria japonica]|nr:hypothetical protein SUGI_0525100 [Cryptomeria japonica]